MIFAIIYYGVSALSIIMFLIGVKKYKIQLISLTGISYIISIFVIVLPGYYIATGDYFLHFGLSRGFDFEIYAIYLLFTLLFPVSIIFGRIIGKSFYLEVEFSSRSEKRMNIYFLISLIGLVLIVLNTGVMNIPVLNLLVHHNIHDAMQLKFDMRNNPSMLLFSKYLKFFMLVSMIFTFYYFVKRQLSTHFKYKIFFFLGMFMVLLALSVRLGRDDIAQFMLVLFLASSLISANRYLIIKFLFLAFLMMFLWIVFSHYDQSFYDVLYNIFMRIVAQTGFSYIQVTSIEEGLLGINGIQMPLFGSLLGQDFVSPSKEAYNLFYNTDSGYGTAGLAFAQMYFIFGFIGLFVASGLVSLIALIDEVLVGSIYMAKKCQKSTENISFLIAVFLTFIVSFYIQILTNFFSFFSFPFIFSFTLYIFIMIVLILSKFKVKVLTLTKFKGNR